MKALALAAVAAVGMAGAVQEADAALYQISLAVQENWWWDDPYQEYVPSDWTLWGSFLIEAPTFANLDVSESSTSGFTVLKRAYLSVLWDEPYENRNFRLQTDAAGQIVDLTASFWTEYNSRPVGLFYGTSFGGGANSSFYSYGYDWWDSFGEWRVTAYDDISQVPLPASAFLLAAPVLAGAALSRRRRLTSAE